MTKTNKIMIGVISVLGVALLIQTGYLMGKYSNSKKDVREVDREEKYPVQSMFHDPVYQQPPSVRPVRQWDPFEEMARMQQAMSSMFDDVMTSSSSGSLFGSSGWQQSYQPNLDVVEKNDEYIYRIDLPGIDKDKVDVKIHNHALTISGVREIEQNNDDAQNGFYRFERSSGSFMRTIPLPEDAQRSGMKANMKDGVLEIRIPKILEPSQSTPKDLMIQ